MNTTIHRNNDSRTERGPAAVEHRRRLSYEEFARDYLYPLKPVVISGALEQWKAIGRWTPEFFKNRFADLQFTIQSAEVGQASYQANGGDTFTMADFIDRVLASTDGNPAPYLRNKILSELFPSLKSDIEPSLEYFEPNWLGDRYLVKHVGEILNRGAATEIYIGGRGGSFPVLHYDGAGTHAFLMQIFGRKEYIIYSPDQEKFLYPSADKPNISEIGNIEKPDLDKFPDFRKAVATRLVLEPGELLFVPAHWWHTAKMLSPSITLSVNVLNASNWHELIDYVAERRRNLAVSVASRVYLSGAGAWRSWRDRRWRNRVEQQVH